jgi:hypothetical protein
VVDIFLKYGTLHTMPENQRCHSHRKLIFQGGCEIAWLSKEHHLRQRYQIHGALLENSMEKVGDKFVLQFNISPSDRWID